MTDKGPQVGKTMDEQTIASVLDSTDTGVLSLGSNHRGYGFPVSFAYDEANGRILFGFTASPESRKQEFARDTDEATLTVYTYEDVDAWMSVIARGSIHLLEADSDTGQVPNLFFEFERDETPGTDEMAHLDTVGRQWYELDIEGLSGRHSGQ